MAKNPELFDAIKKANECFILDGQILVLSEPIEKILTEKQVEKVNNLIEMQNQAMNENTTSNFVNPGKNND